MSSTTLAGDTSSEPARSAPGPLRAVRLGCRRGGRRLFEGLNLTLEAGQVVWLRGDNGRGKTSLLRLLVGLGEPESGEVRLGERPVRQAAAEGRGPVFVGHANALKDDLTATEALAFMAEMHGRRAHRADIRAALDDAGLSSCADAAVRTLSQGQRRRTALARLALETEPLPWVLDEPLDGLDTASIDRLEGRLRAHLARGGSIILTSHQPVPQRLPGLREAWLQRTGLEMAA